jgi:hypothetical protein
MSSSSNSRTTVSSTGCEFLYLNRFLRPSLTNPVCLAFHPRTSKQPFRSLQSSTSEATGCITSTSHGTKAQPSASWACCRSTSHSRILCPRTRLSLRERKQSIVCRFLGLRRRTSCGTGRRCLRMGCLSMLFERRRTR